MNKFLNKKVHYEWIDTAKIVGIYLVTIGHGSLVSIHWQQYIYSFHMPLFFFLSGMLYHHRSTTETLKHNTRTILVPYLIINIIGLLYISFSYWLNDCLSFDKIISHIGAIMLGLGYTAGRWIPVCTPLWFVITLFIILVVMSFLRTKIQIIAFSIFSVIAFLLLYHFNIDFYIPVDSALMALPFFSAGFITKKLILEDKRPMIIETAIALVMLFGCYILSNVNGRVSLGSCNFGNNILLFYVTAFLGTIGFINMSKVLDRIRLKMRVGGGKSYVSGLFIIMGFNVIVVFQAQRVVEVFFPSLTITTPLGMLIGIVILLLFWPIITFCKKYIPAIVGFR